MIIPTIFSDNKNKQITKNYLYVYPFGLGTGQPNKIFKTQLSCGKVGCKHPNLCSPVFESLETSLYTKRP